MLEKIMTDEKANKAKCIFLKSTLMNELSVILRMFLN